MVIIKAARARKTSRLCWLVGVSGTSGDLWHSLQVSNKSLCRSLIPKFYQESSKIHFKALWWGYKLLEPMKLVTCADRLLFPANWSTSGTDYQVPVNQLSGSKWLECDLEAINTHSIVLWPLFESLESLRTSHRADRGALGTSMNDPNYMASISSVARSRAYNKSVNDPSALKGAIIAFSSQ